MDLNGYIFGDPCPVCACGVTALAEVAEVRTGRVVAYALHPCGHKITAYWWWKVQA